MAKKKQNLSNIDKIDLSRYRALIALVLLIVLIIFLTMITSDKNNTDTKTHQTAQENKSSQAADSGPALEVEPSDSLNSAPTGSILQGSSLSSGIGQNPQDLQTSQGQGTGNIQGDSQKLQQSVTR